MAGLQVVVDQEAVDRAVPLLPGTRMTLPLMLHSPQVCCLLHFLLHCLPATLPANTISLTRCPTGLLSRASFRIASTGVQAAEAAARTCVGPLALGTLLSHSPNS